ncbi:MAG: hypothetical protein EG823_06665 [Actinobacteria bacterium]|nr:hypothetical protein [Actinomycetota bacterium]
MTRRVQFAAAVLAAVLAFATSPAANALPSDDTIPGVTLTSSPVAGTAYAATDPKDIFNVTLQPGETLALALTINTSSATEDCDLDLHLYGPGTATAVHTSAIAKTTLPPASYPEILNYTSASGGTYYVEVFAFEGSGPYTLTWAIVPEPLLPVYRFYNVRTGTHFYTPSLEEANSVTANYGNVFTYEGIAYYTKASKNNQPLYRFYNRRNGSHFYTASLEEANSVIARYSNVFSYDGPTYSVSTSPAGGKIPVYRFYNVRNGSHFFTASLEEANNVSARYGNVYQYEGPAFYLGQ